MTLQPSDAYPLLDYRHGPKSNVDENMLVTVLISDRARNGETLFLKDMKALNGTVFAICDKADQEIKEAADYLVEVDSGLPEFARDILYMPPVHFLAYYRALARGQDPDNPTNLTYWVNTSR
jgi:glucosamine--fructose-6-phosphate aminotransferase (isomerizing)